MRSGVAALAAAALLLAGCTSDENQPDGSPSPAPAASPDGDIADGFSTPVEDRVYPDVGDPGVDALHYGLQWLFRFGIYAGVNLRHHYLNCQCLQPAPDSVRSSTEVLSAQRGGQHALQDAAEHRALEDVVHGTLQTGEDELHPARLELALEVAEHVEPGRVDVRDRARVDDQLAYLRNRLRDELADMVAER